MLRSQMTLLSCPPNPQGTLFRVSDYSLTPKKRFSEPILCRRVSLLRHPLNRCHFIRRQRSCPRHRWSPPCPLFDGCGTRLRRRQPDSRDGDGEPLCESPAESAADGPWTKSQGWISHGDRILPQHRPGSGPRIDRSQVAGAGGKSPAFSFSALQNDFTKRVKQQRRSHCWDRRKLLHLNVVRKGGFEPPHSCECQPLKLVRLPVPPLPQ